MDGKSRILLVDDNVNLCRSMAFILKRKGYDVAHAKDGPEAVAMAAGTPFDMIFMDIKMPVMDGAETYCRIKRIQPRAVVMMMTAYADEELIERALVEGACGIVHKPLEIEKILWVIEEVARPVPAISVLLAVKEVEAAAKLKRLLSRNDNTVHLMRSREVREVLTYGLPTDIAFVEVDPEGAVLMEILCALREYSPETAVILMADRGAEEAESAERALREGAYTCLYKPLDMEKILDLVAEINVSARGSAKRRPIDPGSH